MQTKPNNNKQFMEVGMYYWEDPYLASRELVAS